MRGFTRASARLAAALLVVCAALPLFAANQRRSVFGPEKFTRTTGNATAFTRSFDVPPLVGAPFTLRVANGESNGKGGVRNGVASASILVDGQEVVRQQDFNAATASIEKTLTLTPGAHALEVRLYGSPDNFLSLTIDGTITLADLGTPRSGHTATLLADGSVLIAGSGTAERFDGATLTTAPLAPMRSARADHAAAALARPQTLLVGGVDGAATLGSAEAFDHAGRAFTALAASTQISRSGATATTLLDGRILILGGLDASGNTIAQPESFASDPLTGALYDPATATFQFLPNALLAPRSNHTATALPDGKILIAGGRNGQTLLATVELFDPSTGHSTAIVSMSVARAEHSATLRADGSILIAGGRTPAGIADSTEVWKGGWTEGEPLLAARANHTATLLPNGEILIAGGTTANGSTNHTELVAPVVDATAAAVAATFPANNAIDVFRNTIVGVRFSQPVSTPIRLMLGTTAVAGSATIAESGLYAFFAPDALLLPGTLYTIVAGNATSSFTTIAPPSITGYTPTHALPGATITIEGDRFDVGPARNKVTIGGVLAGVTAATRTSLTVVLPQLTPGPHNVVVETFGGSATGTNAFIIDNPAPSLASITPNEVASGSAPVTITLDGANFLPTSTVMLRNNAIGTQFVSATQLRATIPAADLVAAATLQISVVNPAPGGGTSAALPFTVKASRGSIGDFVWHDTNADGIQGANESPLAGVTVRLLDSGGAPIATTTTNIAGGYLFADLANGEYFIEFVAPAGYAFGPRFAIADNGSDSDADPSDGRSTIVALNGAERKDVDAGLTTPLATIETSPFDGEANVAVTRETIFRLSNALAPDAVVTNDVVYAEQGGVKLATRIHVAPDRQTITLFYDRDLPASSRVKATLNGTLLRDRFGAPLDANGDGLPGGVATVNFDTVTLTTLPDTVVCGRVFASQLAPNGTSSINVPLAGVTITVDGLETTLRTTTDAMGNFCLNPAPVGDFFVHIDGRSATNAVAVGDYYPSVGKLWTSIAGETVNIGDVFLPRIVTGTLQPVSPASDTVIAMPASVVAQFPQLQGVQITVPADSLYADDGSRGGRVGIAPVPPDRLPAPLPQGLSFPLVITVQTDGPGNFDRPVPACFPNLPSNNVTLQPGDKSALWSFNHDTGNFEIVGPMTVTADGRLVCTDPAVGILAPGWHGTQPGTSGDSETPGDGDGDGDPDDDDDGIPDDEDPDDDNDGIPDSEDPDDDNDGNPDRDSDGDGVPDNEDPDDDNDGIPDEQDPDDDNDGRPDDADSDGDGIPDAQDPDDDNDGIPDEQDDDDDNDGKKDCDEIKADLNAQYNQHVDTGAALLSHQLQCLAEGACGTGPNAPPPFVHNILEDISNTSWMNPTQALCSLIPGWIAQVPIQATVQLTDVCGLMGGTWHFGAELIPGFWRNCSLATDEAHAALLQHVGPCFDRVHGANEMGDLAHLIARGLVPPVASGLRKVINFFCPNPPQSGTGRRVSSLSTNEFTREDLFNAEVDVISPLRVRAADGSFFLPVGATVPLKVTRIVGGSEVDVTASSLYFVAVANGEVTVTDGGVLSIRKMPIPVVGLPAPFYVIVGNGTDRAIGQFAITDSDTDADGIYDSAERAGGTAIALPNGYDSDVDFDGLPDAFEYATKTKPTSGDTDGDRVDDGTEDRLHTNPFKPTAGSIKRKTGVFHYAVTNVDTGFVFRGTTTPQGTSANVIMAADTRYRATYYDPKDKSIGTVQYKTGGNGTRVKMPIAMLGKSIAADSDNDGIPNDAEDVLGTNPNNPDTDGDGVKDGAEIEQNTNPLDGKQARTGIIATAPTPAAAVDVNALDDLVAVATGTSGVSLFNVFNGMNPTVVAQIDTPGEARQVAFSRRTLAVADGREGVAIIDVTDPTRSRLVRSVPLTGDTQCITASAGIAYAGTDAGRVALVDLTSGTILHELAGFGNVQDVAVEGDTLFVATTAELHAYSLNTNTFLGKTGLSAYGAEGITRRRRLFVGGGIAYVTSYPGYDAINVANPASMKLAGAARDAGANSFKQIVANGSGLGVAAVGINPRNDGTHDVWLYDVTNPAVTNRMLTQLPTPGITRAVSIYNGLAYAADSESGLHVVNYLPFDTRGVAPAITLQSNFASGAAEEGKAMRLTALVTDDVQVRGVEFYIDDQRAVADGSFPFEYRFVTPLMSAQPSFTMRACATDTGGNRTCTATTTITLTTDATPPRVTSTSPANAASITRGTISAISATFTEPMSDSMITSATFRLFAAGADGLSGTADDVAVPGGVITYRTSTDSAFLTFPAPLPDANYRAVLSGTITDRRGNPIGADHAWTFRVRGPLVWTNAAGGRWSDANNWNEKVIPGAADHVQITLPGTYTVTVDRAIDVAKVLVTNANATMWVRGNGPGGNVNMVVAESLENHGTIRFESTDSGYSSRMQLLANATLINKGTIRFDAGTGGERRLTAPFLHNSGTILTNVDVPIVAAITNTGRIEIAANRTLTLPSGTGHTFNQLGGTIAGPGAFRVESTPFNFEGGTLSIAPLLIHSHLTIGPEATSAATFILGGTANLNGRIHPGQTVWVRGSGAGHTFITAPNGFTNQGTLRIESIDSGYSSRFAIAGNGTFVNEGAVDVNPGTGGDRTMALELDNRGTFNVNVDLRIEGQVVNRGTFNTAPNRSFSLAGRNYTHDGGTLQNNGAFSVANATFDFNGGAINGNPIVLNATHLDIAPAATAPVSFILGGSANLIGQIGSGQSIWVRGSGSGHTSVTLVGTPFINRGTLRVESIDSGYTSNLSGNLTNAAEGVVNINGGTGGSRNLTGTWSNAGALNVNASNTNFTGTLTNTGTLTIAANQKLLHNGTGATFHQNGGTLAVNGAFELNGGDFNHNGGAITGAQLFLVNVKLALNTPAQPASFRLMGGSTKVAGTIGAGQTVWLNGGGYASHTTLTTNPSLRNEGTLRVESTDSGYASNVSGTLVNAAGATLTIGAGSGGSRDINGTFTNEGTVAMNYSTRFIGTATIAGAINIAAGQQLSMSGPTNTLKLTSGGSINGPGTLHLDNITFEANGGAVTAPLTAVNGKLQLTSPTQNITFVLTGNPVVTGTVYPTQTLWIRGGGQGGHTTVSFPEGLVNQGTIRLQSIDSGYASHIAVGANQTLTNAGTIEALAGSGGSRIINGVFVNNGLFDVKYGSQWAGSLTNNGTINIAAGQSLGHSGNASFVNNGTINLAGAFDFNAGGLYTHNGVVSGNAMRFNNTKLTITSPAAGSFTMLGGSASFSGNLSAAQSMWIMGSSQGAHTNVTSTGSFTNAGTIRMESRDSSWSSNLTITGTLTNTGTIETVPGSGGSRQITGTVINDGLMDLKYATTWTGTLTNNATLNVATGQRLTHNGTATLDNKSAMNVLGSFDVGSGGTYRHAGSLTGSTMTITSGGRLQLAGAGAGAFTFTGNATFEGDVAAAQSITIVGSSSGGHITVTSPASFTNAGTMKLESRDSSWSSNFTVNGTLTNTGTFNVFVGSGGSRTLTGNVINRGVFDVRHPLTFNSQTFDNQAGGTLRGSSSVNLASGTATLTNGGTLMPDGVLTATRVTQAPAGAVAIEIGGPQYDRLTVTGAAAFDGALDIALTNNYSPDLGATFDVVTFGTRTGSFSTINGLAIGGGKKFQATYGTTFVRLTVVAE